MTREMGDTIRNTIGVESIDEYVTKIQKNGGKMLAEKTTIPGVGSMAAFQDTEGNISVVIEPEPMD